MGVPKRDDMTEIDLLLGRSISRRRRKAGLTQEELGRRLHVSEATVAAFEEGRRRASAQQLFEIAECLDVTIDGFFDWVDPSAPDPVLPEGFAGPETRNLAGHYAALSTSHRAAIYAFLLALGRD